MSERVEKEFDLTDWIMSGRPVPLEVDGGHFSLRQPTPAEVDRLRFVQDKSNAWAYNDAARDGLDEAPISAGLEAARGVVLELLERQYKEAEAEGDSDAMRSLDAEISATNTNWPQNRAQELAREYSRRAVARWMVDSLLADEDGGTLTVKQRREFVNATLPDALGHDAVIEATGRLLQLINYRPNS